MGLEVAIRSAGVLLFGLLAVNALLLARFGLREEVRRVSPLTRDVFYSHYLFTMVVVAGMGALALFYAADLLRPGRLATALTAGMAAFWALRLLAQLFLYSPALWRGHLGRSVGHAGALLLFGYIAAVFARAFWLVSSHA